MSEQKGNLETPQANTKALDPFTEILLGCASFGVHIEPKLSLERAPTKPQPKGSGELDDWTYVVLGAIYSLQKLRSNLPTALGNKKIEEQWDPQERLLR